MQSEGNTGPGPSLCLNEGKVRSEDSLHRGLKLHIQVFNLIMRETHESLSRSLVLGTLPKWFSFTSVLSSPFCIPSSTVGTRVLNFKFYFLSAWFWVIFPVPLGFLPPTAFAWILPTFPGYSFLPSPSNLWCLLTFPPTISHTKATTLQLSPWKTSV